MQFISHRRRTLCVMSRFCFLKYLSISLSCYVSLLHSFSFLVIFQLLLKRLLRLMIFSSISAIEPVLSFSSFDINLERKRWCQRLHSKLFIFWAMALNLGNRTQKTHRLSGAHGLFLSFIATERYWTTTKSYLHIHQKKVCLFFFLNPYLNMDFLFDCNNVWFWFWKRCKSCFWWCQRRVLIQEIM